MTYTLKDFAEALRLLLVKAHDAGHDVDDIGQTADSVLQAEWDKPITDDMIPDNIEDEI